MCGEFNGAKPAEREPGREVPRSIEDRGVEVMGSVFTMFRSESSSVISEFDGSVSLSGGRALGSVACMNPTPFAGPTR